MDRFPPFAALRLRALPFKECRQETAKRPPSVASSSPTTRRSSASLRGRPSGPLGRQVRFGQRPRSRGRIHPDCIAPLDFVGERSQVSDMLGSQPKLFHLRADRQSVAFPRIHVPDSLKALAPGSNLFDFDLQVRMLPCWDYLSTTDEWRVSVWTSFSFGIAASAVLK